MKKRKVKYLFINVFLTLLFILLTASLTFAGSFNSFLLKDVNMVYRSRASENDNFVTHTDRIIKTSRNEKPVYLIEIDEHGGEKKKSFLSYQNLDPILIELFNNTGELEMEIKYKNKEVIFNMPDIQETLEISEGDNYVDVNTLYYTFRGFPFGDQQRIVFNLIMDGRGNSDIGINKMYVEEIAREDIEVKAGHFDTYHLEMGVAGFRGLFASKYKYSFWFTAEEPHYLVKYKDHAKGGVTELISREER